MLSLARRSFHSAASRCNTSPPVAAKARQEQLNKIAVLIEDTLPSSPTSDEPSPGITQGKKIRPIQLNRDFLSRQSFRKRPAIGPGREARYNDPFLQLSIDPRRECENGTLMNTYLTRMGKIQTRAWTGLTQRSQRLLGKAIKRSRMLGIISRFNKTYKGRGIGE